MNSALRKLRSIDAAERMGGGVGAEELLVGEFVRAGAKFAVVVDGEPKLEDTYYAAARKLLDCIKPNGSGQPILQEGGVYFGCWLESTGTINAELLSRFLPTVARGTFEQFADLQREDGLLPYKITGQGAVFKQIQLVTPPARSVWNHAALHGESDEYVRKMYDALSRYDAWLAANRDTRGTGCVEAFCAFDTGHDLSARFWHVPDTPYRNDPSRYDPHSPVLPFLAPDLTASVYCSRLYLGRMAERLGLADEAAQWAERAEASLRSLFEHCYDAGDDFFYDVDRNGSFVRVQSDVLLRVLACEVGDDALFERMMRNYLLNTRKFFAKYPLTSVAMDDPRFDPHAAQNSWSGPTNFLSLIRTAHAFEAHGRHVELTWILQPIVSAVSRMERFAQTLNPWTGEEGYTETYSPAILCALDFIERLCGIVPTPDGDVWLTGLLPETRDHGVALAAETGYARTIDGYVFELANGADECEWYVDGRLVCRFPAGVRLVADRRGALKSIVGMSAGGVEGVVEYEGSAYPIRLAGNEAAAFRDGRFVTEFSPGVASITY